MKKLGRLTEASQVEDAGDGVSSVNGCQGVHLLSRFQLSVDSQSIVQGKLLNHTPVY